MPNELSEKEKDYQKYFSAYDADRKIRVFTEACDEEGMMGKRYPVPEESLQTFKDETYGTIKNIKQVFIEDGQKKIREKELLLKYLKNW